MKSLVEGWLDRYTVRHTSSSSRYFIDPPKGKLRRGHGWLDGKMYACMYVCTNPIPKKLGHCTNCETECIDVEVSNVNILFRIQHR